MGDYNKIGVMQQDKRLTGVRELTFLEKRIKEPAAKPRVRSKI